MNDDDIATRPVGTWLEALASDAPAPGGGAAAALNVAVGAALIEMVCNLTIGKPRYAEHEATMTSALSRATELRKGALALAGEDAAAFSRVSTAYRMPRETDEERTARTAEIQSALLEAADVPLRTAEAAAEVISLAGDILEGANKNVVSDVAVAAASARSGLDGAAVNVEVNLASLDDAEEWDKITSRLTEHRAALAAVDRIVAEVRQKIAL